VHLGVLQGSTFELSLFYTFVSNIGEKFRYHCDLSANDLKTYKDVRNLNHITMLQNDFNKSYLLFQFQVHLTFN
jgi:hypothetical protein